MTTKDGDRLTDEELQKMGEDQKKCCDCGGSLLRGPQGGGSYNMACPDCGSEFNWIMPFGVERISDKGPRELGDRAELYRPMKEGE